MRRIVMLSTLAASMAVMFAFAGSASAIPPDTVDLGTDTGDELLVKCGTFDIRDDFVVEGTMTTFYDRNGEPVRIRFHFRYVDRFYNSETGKEYTATTANTIDFVDVQSGQLDAMGLEYLLTVPGVGVVILDAGKLIETADGEVVFESGKHQILGNETDTDKFCAALAGEPEL
jgi:hypothetical protein